MTRCSVSERMESTERTDFSNGETKLSETNEEDTEGRGDPAAFVSLRSLRCFVSRIRFLHSIIGLTSGRRLRSRRRLALRIEPCGRPARSARDAPRVAA